MESSETKIGLAVDAQARSTHDVRFRMRISGNQGIALGPGKVALLESVRQCGSITAAAKHLGMSYRRAWLLIDELNRSLSSPATVSAHGGNARGSCVLTPNGEEIVRLYREIEAQAYRSSERNIALLTSLMRSDTA